MYFKSVPKIVYPFGDENFYVTDIHRRVGVFPLGKKNRAFSFAYFVQDGEKPEHIAHNYYGSSKYHWVILLYNDIVNVTEEWPIHSNDLFEFCESKYGTGNATDVHHYKLRGEEEIIVDYDPGKYATGEILDVTNYQYEEELNDKKRQIFLLKKDYLREFVSQYKSLIQK